MRRSYMGAPLALILLGSSVGAQDFRVSPAADRFSDVSSDHWAHGAVDWLRREGMLEGWGRKFHGRRQFTRYEMAEILARYTQRLLEFQRSLLEERKGPGPELGVEMDELGKAMERIARMVATHQALLEDPKAQASWRRRLDVLRNRAPRLPSVAPGARHISSHAPPPEPQATSKLLASLDALEVRRPPREPAARAEFVYFDEKAPDLGTRARQVLGKRHAPRASLRLSRSLRGATPEIVRAGGAPSPGPSRGSDQLDSRIMDVLDEVRSGRMDPEQARVVAYLASLALEARKTAR